ncbi:hypothetical protein [Dactylosporangium sp. CA-092794]|uniref:hypothetical protein n=1 Tax=Dactylosporangium sp. CA-092794 TaxID=3239929 RepID=UPI003D8EFFCB
MIRAEVRGVQAVRTAGGWPGGNPGRGYRWGWLVLRYRCGVLLRLVGGLVGWVGGLVGLPVVLCWLQVLLGRAADWRAVLAEPPTVVTVVYAVLLVGWLGWLWLATALVHDVVAAVRHRQVRPRLPVGWSGLVGGIAGVAAVLEQSSAAAAATPPAVTSTVADGFAAAVVHQPALPGAGPVAASPAGRPAGLPPGPVADGSGVPTVTYVVRRGDWLGQISGRFLGDADRYPEVARLNTGLILDTSGRRGPDHIEAGWRLVLPADADDRGPRRHARGTAEHRPGAAVGSGSGRTAVPSAPATATPAAPAASPTASAAAPLTGTSGPAPARTATAPDRTDRRLPGGWFSIPIIAAAATGATVWLRRRSRAASATGSARRRAGGRPQPPAVPRRAALHGPVADAPSAVMPGLSGGDRQDDGGTRRVPASGGVAGAGRVEVPVLGAAGRALRGPGAHAAARGLLVTTVSASGPDMGERGRVVIPAETLVALFPDAADRVATVVGVHVTASLLEAIADLEALLIERGRRVEDDATDGPAALPPVLLLAGAPAPDQHARLHAVLQLGAAVGITAATLGDWPDGEPCTVRPDGQVAEAGYRLLTLDPATAGQLLSSIDDPQVAPAPTPPARTSSTGAHVDARPGIPDRGPVGALDPQRPGQAAAAPADPANNPSHHPAAGPAGDTDVPDPGPAPSSTAAAQGAPEPADGARPQAAPADGRAGLPASPVLPVRVRLLGAPAVYHADGSVGTGLRLHARELMVYLAVHRDGADLADIMEAMWPLATVKRAGERLSTEVANLRRHVREAAGRARSGRTGGASPAGRASVEPVVNTGGRYHLNPDAVDIDLWRLDDALRAAAAAAGPDERIQHLLSAVHAHTGVLADGCNYEWLDPHRERVRRHGIRARVGSAELLGPADPAAAAELLQAAADLDPQHDELARRAIRALAGIGDLPAAGRRLTQLREALAAIGEAPSPATLALAAELSIPTTEPPATDG